MKIPRILVVEDEGIIAQDIKNCLENIGYEVPEVVYTGYDAIERTEILRPDLVLMDIVLKGEIDGIETAAEIKKRFNIPIVYLTAYEDDNTIKRAKVTEPLGYILKPFEERYLRSSIEMALYKHKMENKIKNNERWLSTILKSVGDAVIVIDDNEMIRYMNPMAESLTGWKFKEAFGKKLPEVFKVIDEDTRKPAENTALRAFKDNTITGHFDNTLLISRDGREITIDDTAAPMRDDDGNVSGVVVVFNDITERRIAEQALKDSEKKYRDLFDNAGEAIFVQSYNGNIISVNKEGCKLLGYTREEFYKLDISDFTDKVFYEDYSNIINKLKSGDTYNGETKFLKKDRKWVNVELRMSIINFLDDEVVQIFVRDITKIKETQKQVQMLAQAVKSISECVTITDLNNRIIFVNEAFVNTYGYTFEELKGKTLNIIRSQKNPQDLGSKIYKHTLMGGWQGEFINRSKDGREFPIMLSTSIIRDDKGEPIALIGVALDISERKKLEDTIRDSEKDYKGLFENAHDAIIIFRPDDEIILDVNQRASEIYGYSREEFVGMTLETLSGGKQNNSDLIKDTGNETKARFETVHYRKTGEPMNLEINSSFVNYKGQKAIVTINRDVSERKLYEKELLDSTSRKSAILESSTDAILILDKDAKIIEWNQSAEKIFSYTSNELYHKNIKDLIINLEDSNKVDEELSAVASGKNSSGLIEMSAVGKDDKVVPAEVSITRVNIDGEITFLITIRDITERLKAEEALRVSEARYRYVAKATNDAVWDWDLLNDKIEWNEGLNILFGFDHNIKVTDGNWWEERIHPEDKNRVIGSIDKIIRNKEQLWFDEYRFKYENGKYAYVIDRGYVLYDLNNNPVRMIGCMTDVTKRKEAEHAAFEREKQYRDLTQSAPIAVTRMNMLTQDYEFVNDEFVRQSGYTREEYNKLDKNALITMIHEDDRDKIFDFYKTWSLNNHQGTQHIDYRIINKKNETLWLDTYLFADFDDKGNIKAVNQICIDITDQKKAQEIINQSEKRFRTLIENSSDMIALADVTLNIQYASPSTERILGYTSSEYLNKNFLELVYADDLENVSTKFKDLISSNINISSLQCRIKNKKNNRIWIELTAANLLNDPVIRSIIVNYRDITERKKAEDEIMLQKSYFQQLFENSPEAIAILNNEDKVVEINKGFERMFQFSKDEMTGKNLNKFIVPDEFYENAAQMSTFVLRGEVIHKETVRKRKDGSNVDVSVLAYPITLGKDQIGVYGIYSDITIRKQTEKALKNSEERYRVFVNQSTEGIWRFEFLEPIPTNLSVEEQVERAYKYGFMAECNDSVAKMYGFNNAEDITGIQLSQLLPRSNPLNVEYLKKFIESGYRISDIETNEIDSNGESKYFVNTLLGIVEDKMLIRAWGTQRDITNTKLAELELHKTQLRLTTLLRNLPDVVLYESGGETEFITDNVINLLGYPSSEFEKDRGFFNRIIHPGDLKEMERNIQDWRKGGSKGILNLEFRCRRADGIYIWLEDHMVALHENEKHITAGVMVDITERKRSEEKLIHLAEKLSASNKELEQFAYVASHDLQEPLRMVASYIQLLQKRYKDKLGDEANEFIDFAVDGVVRMKVLINDLLVYSRVNTREMPIESVNVNDIIEKVKDNLKTSIEDNKATIISSDMPVIMANNLQLTQLFQNLISNAIKFHGDEKPVVEIGVKKADKEWMFSVKDNGIGIAKEYTEKVFVIFQRLHNYMEYPGTGIGLAICKKIVEKLGGHIWVESEPGKGSIFYFTIPEIN